ALPLHRAEDVETLTFALCVCNKNSRSQGFCQSHCQAESLYGYGLMEILMRGILNDASQYKILHPAELEC
ncbi:MAG: hypothetical protein QM686_21570, partial [Herbaspirillum sp.]